LKRARLGRQTERFSRDAPNCKKKCRAFHTAAQTSETGADSENPVRRKEDSRFTAKIPFVFPVNRMSKKLIKMTIAVFFRQVRRLNTRKPITEKNITKSAISKINPNIINYFKNIFST